MPASFSRIQVGASAGYTNDVPQGAWRLPAIRRIGESRSTPTILANPVCESLRGVLSVY
jgi:hypothetical protein